MIKAKGKLSWLIIALIMVIISPFFALGIYDFVEIRPKLPAIHAILQNASPQDRNPPLIIQNLIDASFNFDDNEKNSYVTRLVLNQAYPIPMSPGTWHFRHTVWQLLLPLHFNQKQRYCIYNMMTEFGGYQGLNDFALHHFGKPLDQLTTKQSAITVAIVHSPTRFLRNSEALDERANYLLLRLENKQVYSEK